MSGTAVVAIYAAIIATAGLGWQIYTWGRIHKTRVTVSITNAIFGFPEGNVGGVTIEAVNNSSHPIRVKSAGFEMNDGTDRHLQIIRPGFGSSLPGQIEPHDSGMIWMREEEMHEAGCDIYKPLVAWVSTPEGTFKSKALTMRTR